VLRRRENFASRADLFFCVLSPTAWATVAEQHADPGLRGLALGYMLSPTAWATVAEPYANPGLRGLALGYTLTPTSWASA
jgi:hypothetical protein